jgi:mRNA-degrading endonuclease toxin of MazEF toxin-antitoxin module
MIVQRGEIWFANLNPTRGSEQAGMRPVLILQNDAINRLTTTELAIPLRQTSGGQRCRHAYALLKVKED